MNSLKTIFFLCAAVALINLSSCKDDDCTAPEVSANIVGTWNPVLSGGEVTFNADGTYSDDDGALLSIGTSSADDTRTYTISGTTLSLSVESGSGSGSISTDFEITQNECDQIKFSVLGIEETLNRK